MSKIKRLKFKKDSSDAENDDDDEEYVCGGAESQPSRWTAPKAEIETIQDQIRDINNKFRGLEDKASAMKEIIVKQNNDIKRIYSELIQLKRDEESKFSILLKQLRSAPSSVFCDRPVQNEPPSNKPFKGNDLQTMGNLQTEQKNEGTTQHFQNNAMVVQNVQETLSK
mgnify:CR=1 FL=1